MGREPGERDSRFELMRIVSMLLILVCHFASHAGRVSRIHGGWGALACLLSQNRQIGVVMFLMTAGWFLVDRPFRWRTALCIQVFAYSVTVFAAVSVAVCTCCTRTLWGARRCGCSSIAEGIPHADPKEGTGGDCGD